jgi:hypothetical protein
MVAEGVVDFEAEILLGFCIEIEELRGASCIARSVPWTPSSSGCRWQSVRKRKLKPSFGARAFARRGMVAAAAVAAAKERNWRRLVSLISRW